MDDSVQPMLVGVDRESDRHLYVLELQAADTLPSKLKITSKYFGVLIAWDAKGAPADTIALLGRRLIESGCAFICTWGDDGERVLDLVDRVWVDNYFEQQSSDTLMTSCHNSDSLEAAIWYAIAAPTTDRYEAECRSVIGISIANAEWASRIREAFSDSENFGNVYLSTRELDDEVD